jgi:outer membrane protein
LDGLWAAPARYACGRTGGLTLIKSGAPAKWTLAPVHIAHEAIMSKQLLPLCAALVLGTLATPALAQSAGDWTFGVGVHQVNPKSDNGSLAGNTLDVEVGNDIKPTITAEYFIRDNLGIEVLASWPFEHDIAIAGLGTVGSTKQLPPTVSLQYHFDAGKVRPFVGAGVNYTLFFSEDATGALDGSRLSLDDSWGLAAHAGLDFAIGERGALRVDVRWMDIDTDVELDGADIGTVQIDPLAYGIAYVFQF